VVSEDGKVVWLARYMAWDGIYRMDREEIRQPLRFQGQYFDEETGLHYNRHRYYDPDKARYLTQDPVGLAGGFNLYRYARNPVNLIDPARPPAAKDGASTHVTGN
jgi:RHS repeat-associated protein